jgi:hypothetical protein
MINGIVIIRISKTNIPEYIKEKAKRETTLIEISSIEMSTPSIPIMFWFSS